MQEGDDPQWRITLLCSHLPVHPVLDVGRGAELVGQHSRHLGHLAA